MTRHIYSCQVKGGEKTVTMQVKRAFTIKINNLHVYYNCYVKYFDLYLLYFVKYRQRMSVR